MSTIAPQDGAVARVRAGRCTTAVVTAAGAIVGGITYVLGLFLH